MKFDFGEVLSRMWEIGWNHKVLWLWQMLPGLAAIVFVPLFFISNPFFMTSMRGSFDEIASERWVSTQFSLASFLTIIPSIFLVVVIQLTTTYGVVKVEKGAEELTFGGLFRESLPYFWRVFGLYLLLGGTLMLIWFSFMVLFMLIFMISATFTFTLGLIFIILSLLLLIPVLVVGYSVGELAQAAIVADNMKTMNAISHGWKLFRTNWLGVTLLMLLLYFAMYFISCIVAFPAIFPMMMLRMGMDSPGDTNTVMPVFILVFFTITYVVVYVVQGILMTFFQSAWAVAYLRLNRNANAPIMLDENSQEAGI